MNIFKIIFKSVSIIESLICSYTQIIKLKLIWSVGSKLTCEGKIYIPSFGGDVRIGDCVRLGPMVRIDSCSGASISIGNNVSLNQGSFLVAKEKIEIGDNCRIGEYVSIRDNDHCWTDRRELIRKQGFIIKPVKIGNDVWIGRGVVIGKGVKIGDGVVIGANSVVTKDIAPYTVVVGIPSRKINDRT